MSAWSHILGSLDDLPAGGPDRPRFPARPAARIEAEEPVSFGSLSDLVLASDMVLRAEVVAVGPGPQTGDRTHRFRLRFVALRPIEMPKGVLTTELVRVAEPGYTLDGIGFEVNGFTWSQVGDEGWFFLERATSEYFRPVSSYGKFRLATTSRGSTASAGPTGLPQEGRGPWHAEPIPLPAQLGAVLRSLV
ncbi:MAG: hypothetical protein J7518_21040 [Nocardioidaceae bacterium]|nr:hypothetical protein [Nocardioidaceae bacterium]